VYTPLRIVGPVFFRAPIDWPGQARPTRVLTTIGHFLFQYRNLLFPVACLPLFLPGPEPFGDTLVAMLLGALVASLGQLVRAITIGYRYVIRGGRGRRVYAEDLVTEGVYAHVRNPMYLGNLLIVVGVALAANSWPTIIVGIPLALMMYVCIVAAEEEYLRSRFGTAFEAYCRDVPRWLPRPGLLFRESEALTFRWRRLLVKEYGTPFGWISAIIVVTLFNFWHDGEWPARRYEVAAIQWAFAITLGFWLIAWRLKRSRTIQAD
jgi:protein-S-isoprenylcysteine O-methyltransferase Ste14